MKKLLIALALLNLMFNITACTAKKAQDETEFIENADVEKAEQDLFALEDGLFETGPVDESLQAALGESGGDFGGFAEDVGSVDVADFMAPEMEETVALDESHVVAETFVDNSADFQPPEVIVEGSAINEAVGPVDESLMADTGIYETPITETPIAETPVDTSSDYSSSYASSYVEPYQESSSTTYNRASVSTSSVPKTPASSSKLLKIEGTEPFTHNGEYVNTVYLARPKESLAEISQTIYGSDRSSELKKINNFLTWRAPRGGDKIYYVSPNRPMDSSRMLSYYEDVGMTPATYVAQQGDNLKQLATTLLGYEAGWKELWSTNPMNSQGRLQAGEVIRYWRGQPVAPTVIAQNSSNVVDTAPSFSDNSASVASPPTSNSMMVEEDHFAHNQFDQPNQDMVQAPDMSVPPPPADMFSEFSGADSMGGDFPPPPADEFSSDMAMAPTPPAEVGGGNLHTEEEFSQEGGLPNDMVMTLGGVIVLVALLALVLIRKNKKKKEAEMASLENTHVGT